MSADFPLDDATLVMLAAACEINPDTGQTHLHDFLWMGVVEKSRERVDDGDEDETPVYHVEFEPGREPFSEHEVIRALVEEIQRLRSGGPTERGTA